jgi:hypothetical protein
MKKWEKHLAKDSLKRDYSKPCLSQLQNRRRTTILRKFNLIRAFLVIFHDLGLSMAICTLYSPYEQCTIRQGRRNILPISPLSLQTLPLLLPHRITRYRNSLRRPYGPTHPRTSPGPLIYGLPLRPTHARHRCKPQRRVLYHAPVTTLFPP